MKFDTQFKPGLIDDSVFVADGVRIFGEVHIGKRSSVWFNSVIRGDTERVIIGVGTNVQDLCLIHADAGKPCVIGSNVTLGHAAIVHGATVNDRVMIGMRATVLNEAIIGEGSLIAAGTLIPERMEIPANSVVMGTPGKVIRQCTEQDLSRIESAAKHYIAAAIAYKAADRQ